MSMLPVSGERPAEKAGAGQLPNLRMGRGWSWGLGVGMGSVLNDLLSLRFSVGPRSGPPEQQVSSPTITHGRPNGDANSRLPTSVRDITWTCRHSAHVAGLVDRPTRPIRAQHDRVDNDQ